MWENIFVGIIVSAYTGIIVMRWSMFYQTKVKLMSLLAHFEYMFSNNTLDKYRYIPPNSKDISILAMEFLYLGHIEANRQAREIQTELADINYRVQHNLRSISYSEMAELDSKWQSIANAITPSKCTIFLVDMREIEKTITKLRKCCPLYRKP